MSPSSVKLWCATTNKGKLREFALAGAKIETLPNMRNIPPSPEDGETFEVNAAQKAIYYSGFAKGLVFADDSGLVVDALHGDPGVRSARYAGENATDAENNSLLLARLRGIEDRSARFVCVVAVAREGELIRTFRGEVEGRILYEPRGDGGFGYDPLFHSTDRETGFAELSPQDKFEVSHRGKAVRAMLNWLDSTSSPQDEVQGLTPI
jgi:XTP/dITP diphosphohydrolase